MLCYVDSESKIQLVRYLNKNSYQIVDKENYKQIDIYSSNDYGKYVESSYVLHESMDDLVNELILDLNLKEMKLELKIQYDYV